MQIKKISYRMCGGCRARVEKSELLRLVKFKDLVDVDLCGKKDGRGAYICKNVDCLKKAMKSRSFERSFKQKISKDIYIKIEEEIL